MQPTEKPFATWNITLFNRIILSVNLARSLWWEDWEGFRFVNLARVAVVRSDHLTGVELSFLFVLIAVVW